MVPARVLVIDPSCMGAESRARPAFAAFRRHSADRERAHDRRSEAPVFGSDCRELVWLDSGVSPRFAPSVHLVIYRAGGRALAPPIAVSRLAYFNDMCEPPVSGGLWFALLQ